MNQAVRNEDCAKKLQSALSDIECLKALVAKYKEQLQEVLPEAENAKKLKREVSELKSRIPTYSGIAGKDEMTTQLVAQNKDLKVQLSKAETKLEITQSEKEDLEVKLAKSETKLNNSLVELKSYEATGSERQKENSNLVAELGKLLSVNSKNLKAKVENLLSVAKLAEKQQPSINQDLGKLLNCSVENSIILERVEKLNSMLESQGKSVEVAILENSELINKLDFVCKIVENFTGIAFKDVKSFSMSFSNWVKQHKPANALKTENLMLLEQMAKLKLELQTSNVDFKITTFNIDQHEEKLKNYVDFLINSSNFEEKRAEKIEKSVKKTLGNITQALRKSEKEKENLCKQIVVAAKEVGAANPTLESIIVKYSKVKSDLDAIKESGELITDLSQPINDQSGLSTSFLEAGIEKEKENLGELIVDLMESSSFDDKKINEISEKIEDSLYSISEQSRSASLAYGKLKIQSKAQNDLSFILDNIIYKHLNELLLLQSNLNRGKMRVDELVFRNLRCFKQIYKNIDSENDKLILFMESNYFKLQKSFKRNTELIAGLFPCGVNSEEVESVFNELRISKEYLKFDLDSDVSLAKILKDLRNASSEKKNEAAVSTLLTQIITEITKTKVIPETAAFNVMSTNVIKNIKEKMYKETMATKLSVCMLDQILYGIDNLCCKLEMKSLGSLSDVNKMKSEIFLREIKLQVEINILKLKGSNISLRLRVQSILDKMKCDIDLLESDLLHDLESQTFCMRISETCLKGVFEYVRFDSYFLAALKKTKREKECTSSSNNLKTIRLDLLLLDDCFNKLKVQDVKRNEKLSSLNLRSILEFIETDTSKIRIAESSKEPENANASIVLTEILYIIRLDEYKATNYILNIVYSECLMDQIKSVVNDSLLMHSELSKKKSDLFTQQSEYTLLMLKEISSHIDQDSFLFARYSKMENAFKSDKMLFEMSILTQFDDLNLQFISSRKNEKQLVEKETLSRQQSETTLCKLNEILLSINEDAFLLSRYSRMENALRGDKILFEMNNLLQHDDTNLQLNLNRKNEKQLAQKENLYRQQSEHALFMLKEISTWIDQEGFLLARYLRMDNTFQSDKMLFEMSNLSQLGDLNLQFISDGKKQEERIEKEKMSRQQSEYALNMLNEISGFIDQDVLLLSTYSKMDNTFQSDKILFEINTLLKFDDLNLQLISNRKNEEQRVEKEKANHFLAEQQKSRSNYCTSLLNELNLKNENLKLCLDLAESKNVEIENPCEIQGNSRESLRDSFNSKLSISLISEISCAIQLKSLELKKYIEMISSDALQTVFSFIQLDELKLSYEEHDRSCFEARKNVVICNCGLKFMNALIRSDITLCNQLKSANGKLTHLGLKKDCLMLLQDIHYFIKQDSVNLQSDEATQQLSNRLDIEKEFIGILDEQDAYINELEDNVIALKSNLNKDSIKIFSDFEKSRSESDYFRQKWIYSLESIDNLKKELSNLKEENQDYFKRVIELLAAPFDSNTNLPCISVVTDQQVKEQFKKSLTDIRVEYAQKLKYEISEKNKIKRFLEEKERKEKYKLWNMISITTQTILT